MGFSNNFIYFYHDSFKNVIKDYDYDQVNSYQLLPFSFFIKIYRMLFYYKHRLYYPYLKRFKTKIFSAYLAIDLY